MTTRDILYTILAILSIQCIIVKSQECSVKSDSDRLDCYPEVGADQPKCVKRGCCWASPRNNYQRSQVAGVPSCFFPKDYPKYYIKYFKQDKNGILARLEKYKVSHTSTDILSLDLLISYETKERLRIKIKDARSNRYEVPIVLQKPDFPALADTDYEVTMPTFGPFSLKVTRKSDGLLLLKTMDPLIYKDQFLQFSLRLGVNKGYGIGEQNSLLLRELNIWNRIGLYNRDNPIGTDINLYGTHPFFMGLSDNGKAYGLYFHNSNAQEFVTQPSSLSFRTIGGIIDLFVFTGDSPAKTVQQYTALLGRPTLPPFWSLGFHLCRYGYKSLQDVSNTLQRNLKAKIPVEVQWTDIDYMNHLKDFTVDPVKFKGIGKFIRNVRSKYGVRYILILDPAISINDEATYKPLKDGLAMNIFIKDSNTGNPFLGSVWPGLSYFPDFNHPNITKYWTNQIREFIKDVPVDGLWIDMNEPANFGTEVKNGNVIVVCKGNNSLVYPKFVPIIRGDKLYQRTVCPDALHHNNVLHYNLHNIYGYSQSLVTNKALQQVYPGKRPFVLSRSTFSGSGHYAAHWTGDNWSNWDNLAHSIRQIINFNIFGIPMVGVDICGFLSNSNEELCIRWMQLGAFYPFMRNHNDKNKKEQDPAIWSKKAQNMMRDAIKLRYRLLPYYYSLFVRSHLHGETVVRPLSFEFPDDVATHGIEHQFMVGSSLIISPAIYPGTTWINAYFPRGIWYDFQDGHLITNTKYGEWVNYIPVPLDKISVVIRGGSILPLLTPAMTTDEMRRKPFVVLAALSGQGEAQGELFWDDGVSLDSYSGSKFSRVSFSANQTSFQVRPVVTNYRNMSGLESLVVFGLKQKTIKTVTVNQKSVSFKYENKILVASNFNVNMLSPVSINWS